MRQQTVNQACEHNSMEGALEALGKSSARWTEKGNQLMTAIPGLSLGSNTTFLDSPRDLSDVLKFLNGSVRP
jgi:hypothetical protein